MFKYKRISNLYVGYQIKQFFFHNIFSFGYKDFNHVTNFFTQISSIESRNEITDNIKHFLVDYFKQPNKELTLNVIRLITGYIGESKELQIGPDIISSLLSELFGIPKEKIKSQKNIKENLASLLNDKFNYKMTQKADENLEINEILSIIDKLKLLKGKGSREQRLNLLIMLCKKCKNEEELVYLLKILQKNLTLGYTHLTVFKALEMIQEQENIPEIDDILNEMEVNIFGFRLDFRKDHQIKIGTPIAPMKARSIDSLLDIFKVMSKYDGKVLCEIKYDGERAQIHYENGKIFSFSRNFEIKNEKFPNLLENLKKHFEALGIKNCIIDCEIVGFDYKKAEMLSFQNLMTKKEKSSEMEGKIYVFDIYYLNDKSLLQEPLPLRRRNMCEWLKSTTFFTPADGLEINLKSKSQEKEIISQINDFFSDAIQQGFEGIIIKTLDEKLSVYSGTSRMQWIKIKKNILGSGIADSLDLIPIAAFWGKGKRSGVFGAYLMAAYSSETDTFEAFCKLGTGFSDDYLKSLTEKLLEKSIEIQPSNYMVHSNLKPDFWFAPSQVWEVMGDSFSLSSIYSIGKNNFNNKGISLRFPRFIRVREDKSIAQSTKSEEIIELFQNEKQNNE